MLEAWPEETVPHVVCEVLRNHARDDQVALARRVFAETDAQKKDIFDERFWNWQYDPGYFSHLNVVVRVNGETARSYPNLILPLHYRGQVRTASICQDLHTAAEHRRLGLFTRMGNKALEVPRTGTSHSPIGTSSESVFPKHAKKSPPRSRNLLYKET